ncbi:SDR family NAD(P)-dependent oxidoreductase [Streptomyces sp. MNU76]|uniref:SDR family NAD(P)-dependent oxidoreductase n=1 Tax=Streptomyces sp. MNU76 TaxID=2560026 RepID=UPI001E519AE4|nr:SDR family NAD(P)-dependent oxidoreductase [Streptomyces sp. MNU76]MCC9705571.1 SDR family NAD(P)-dependent oxidoreductase [Streptomyces sp. MNU76]
MPVIAVIGAGPGLGLSIARRFGREGFQVALVSRTQDKLDALAARLAEDGIEAAGFAADVTRPDSLQSALAAVADRFGAVDVLEYSPADPTFAGAAAVDATAQDLHKQLDYYLYGAVAAVRQVLPAMLERGSGTLLFSTGASSIRPLGGAFGSVGVAAAALRNYAMALGIDLAEHGVHAAHVAIGVFIGSGPGTEPETIAEHYWNAYTKRDQAEIVHTVPGGIW